MENKKVRITISIDSLILESLDYYASIHGMSRSAYVTKLVTDVMWETEDFYRKKAPIGYGYCEEY